MGKKFCSIHHLYYNGVECPMCLDERVKRMEEKFVKRPKEEKKESKQSKSNVVTDDMLDRLKAKFGSK